jgi:Zn-dependent peptidase ImmA (M78 family)/DNA-binding XRE family transcriptional regulator
MQMKKVNHRLIILARESREMTQSALSRVTGIPQGTVSKIEGGLLACPEDALQTISEHLDYPPAFFYADEMVHGVGTEAHHCLYRRKAAVSAKTLKRIEAEVNIKRMHASRMLGSIDMHAELSIPSYDPSEFDGDIERIAMSVRAYWGLPSGPIDNVTELIERAGGVVIPHDFGTNKVDATSVRINGLPPLFFISTALSGDRLRFTLAHELGHAIMHSIPHPKIEDEADRFAAEFLMPAADIGPSLTRLDLAKAARLKLFWKISMAAIVYRAHELGRITSNQYRYLFYQLSSAGYRTVEPAELDIPVEVPSVHASMLEFFKNDLAYTTDDIKNLFQIGERDFNRFYVKAAAAGRLRAVK